MERESEILPVNYPREINANVDFRQNLVIECLKDMRLASEVRLRCASNIMFWIDLFCWTKDPRKDPDILPFITYDAFQQDSILEIQKAIDGQYDLLAEKSRDMGASWMVLYVLEHKWLFEPGSDFRIGSRKEEFVDRTGDIDTLFEKLRFNLERQPNFLMPPGFDWRKHSSHMRLINPYNENAMIGESANEDFGSGGRRKAVLLDEYSKWDHRVAESCWTACYSKDTEALTSKGWKLIKDIKLNDLVYSMNPKSGNTKFMPVLKTYEQQRDELIHFKSKSIDLLVTKNHKIVYRTIGCNVHFKDAQRAMSMKSGKIPLVSDNKNTYNPKTIYGFPSGDWMEFLGWYISEGCTSKGGTIIITQSLKANPQNVERIENLLFHMGIKYSYSKRGKDFNVNVRGMNKKAREELKLLGKCHEKYIPKRYFNFHKSLLLRLYQSLILGDGHDRIRKNRNTNATGYTTTSSELASDFQALAQFIGYKASITSRLPNKDKLILGRKIKSGVRLRYDVTVGYKTQADINGIGNVYPGYDDKVYCVETKYHTLYVRRNGVACWCGNTADVTKCRIPISTPKGSGNKFAILAKGTKEKIRKLTLHWTLHPEKNKGAYYFDTDGKTKIMIDLEDPRMAFEVWKRGKKVRSIWYDAECERRSATDVAQELDINYLQSGAPFFNIEALAKQKAWKFYKRALPMSPIPVYHYIRGTVVELDNKYEFREIDGGWLKVFELPKKGMQYVNAGDTAEGLAKGDECFGVVRDKFTRNVVATYHGCYSPDDFAIKMQKVDRFYNGAKTAPENNNHGFSLCSDLKKMDCNLYYTRKINAEGKTSIIKAGWSTTAASRPQMLDQLEEEIRKGSVELRDGVLIAQCETFVKNEKTGKPEADGEYLDDGVIGLAIGGMVIQEFPYEPPRAKRGTIPQSERPKNAKFRFSRRV